MQVFVEKVTNTQRKVLFFDHDLGGGTTKYREEKILSFLQQRYSVLLVISQHRVKPESVSMKFFQYESTKTTIYESEKIAALELFSFFENIDFEYVFVNSLVSFKPATQFVLSLSIFLQQLSNAKVSIAFHDYYAVCPSFNLLNYQWQYCDVPDKQACVHCQKCHPITTLREPNAENWRTIWLIILELADEVLAFSSSSKGIIMKAFPSLNNKVTVIPHSMTYFATNKINIRPHKPYNIGVLGHMALHKGAQEVLALSEYISQTKSSENIVIFGEFEDGKSRKNIEVLGKYDITELPTLIEKNNINTFFFPSICPETFSYVVEELIILGMPIVCFNLGAQADKIASYDKGMVIELNSSMDLIYQSLNANELKNL